MTAENIDRSCGTVFLVDDDEGVRKALGRLLRAHGFTVRSFDSAVAFLRTFPATRPACAVVDLRMPGMSGLTLQECLNDAGSTLPLIFITGHGDAPVADSALEGGAVAFLQKPLGEGQLLDAVGRALALHDRREARPWREGDASRSGRVHGPEGADGRRSGAERHEPPAAERVAGMAQR